MFRCIYIGFIILAFSISALANSKELTKEQKIAVEYMQTLTQHDLTKLKAFYDRDSVFSDKTAGKTYTGGQHIIDFFKRAYHGMIEYKFDITHIYNKGSFVVMIGEYHFKGKGVQFGKPGKVISLTVPSVTTLELDTENHRIKKHVDMIDYQMLSEQLAVQ
ncbi:nuclear transport factor 2 family protein [Parashewanella spongiae]|uniref:Nuclear transport factor 2 family protein n=1 Tax=Parashewanella spongiae TaxID=342950 RepID=A0A3A6TFX9_9GAMM|nr:nuclear transport factor 2 family protein [Parashewanella spongiae]MCL1079647.1 nuclear transport factor 2 family protein [Parashewanella spongiae]RJY07226.1 nuclear transport factor 2 family protein [Parashewanella spongiae]